MRDVVRGFVRASKPQLPGDVSGVLIKDIAVTVTLESPNGENETS